MSKNKGVKYIGNIASVRKVEDAIRATHKYTEGIFTMHRHHPNSEEIQGEEFPNKVISKYYEYYPDIKSFGWDMSVGTAIDWWLGEYMFIAIVFHYDYRENKAFVRVKDGDKSVELLKNSIPDLVELLDELSKSNGIVEKIKPA